ncbi:hypothetical protein NQ317_000919 [Molorchus minor]|uniref:THAP-type domain-containing protein n=1 Tax=Molorchus minor TaxID=1323400 RepID=A0ABQ9JZX3_9CUCU|nr:hypothetical protein NQ317_000919 [Molorchus minor]
MNYSYYKYCLVPQCKSTTIKNAKQIFIYVPNNEQIRKKWLKLARRDDVHSLSTNSRMQIILITCNFRSKAYSISLQQKYRLLTIIIYRDVDCLAQSRMDHQSVMMSLLDNIVIYTSSGSIENIAGYILSSR